MAFVVNGPYLLYVSGENMYTEISLVFLCTALRFIILCYLPPTFHLYLRRLEEERRKREAKDLRDKEEAQAGADAPPPSLPPDPAVQNFQIGSGSRILLALQESIQTSTKFLSHQTYFFRFLNGDYFYLKKWKNSPDNV